MSAIFAPPGLDMTKKAAAPVDPNPSETPALPDTSTDPAEWGANYEEMPKKYRTALLELVRKYQDARAYSRAFRIRRATQARYMWRGYHQIWWSANEKIFKVLGIDRLPADIDVPKYDYTTNIFRAFGLALAAVISDGKIAVRFWPQNANQQEDIDTAKEASILSELIERQNDMDALSITETYLAYLDPLYAFYVRYVSDGDEYGYDEVDELGEGQAQMGSDHMFCPECQAESPVPPVDPAVDISEQTSPCPSCQSPLTASDYVPADELPIPVSQGPKRFAKGQVQIELISALELDVPYAARRQREISDLTWKTEIHRAKLMATYQFAAEVIRKASTSGSASSSSSGSRPQWAMDEDIERRARMRARTMTSQDARDEGLLTFCRTWLRSWALEELPSETEDQKQTKAVLKAAFPDGAYVAYFGDVYIEARSERLDDSWHLVNLMPGESLDAEAIGTDEISVQRRHNTIDNLTMETFEHGIPPIFADPVVLNLPAFAKTTAKPGAFYEAERPAGMRLSDGFYMPPPSGPHIMVDSYRKELFGPISQFVLGLFPAIYGGELGGNDTAAGIAMQRNQAKGRIGVFYKAMRKARAHVMLKAVEALRRSTMGTLDVVLFDPDSQNFLPKSVNLDDLKGEINAYPESDESFPASWAEKQAQIDQLLANPLAAPIVFSSAKNMTVAQRMKGLGDLEIPGAAERQQQIREINLMAEHAAQGIAPQPGPVMVDPMTGQPIQAPPSSTVPINPIMDDHIAHIKAAKEWWASDEGQVAQLTNPALAQDVMLHTQAHMAAAAPPPMPSAPGEAGAAPSNETQ